VEEWLEAFKTGLLSAQQCATLVRGRFDVKKVETLKHTGRQRTGGMSALAEETRKKMEKRLAGEEE
jgi:hypothetical protein